jgi:hypothetical protein
MKIIGVDNLNREHISDVLVAENLNDYYAQLIVQLLNAIPNQDYYYRAVEDSGQLYKFEP